MLRGVVPARIKGGWPAAFPSLRDIVGMLGLEVWIDGERWRYANKVGPPIHAGTPALDFRRGFLYAIRCPCAVWLEHGPALCRAHPVERVELTDRKAHDGVHATGRVNQAFWWLKPPTAVNFNAWHLPEELFAHLQAGDPFKTPEFTRSSQVVGRSYDTPDEARDDLSRACIAYARQSG